jgi:hypothetical protein
MLKSFSAHRLCRESERSVSNASHGYERKRVIVLMPSREARLLRGQNRCRHGMCTSFADIHRLDADVQVGLPARGKSYLSNRLMRYLRVRTPTRRSGRDIH